MQLQKFISELDKEFPRRTAWENDKIGLQVDNGNEEIRIYRDTCKWYHGKNSGVRQNT